MAEAKDTDTGRPLLYIITDAAGQKAQAAGPRSRLSTLVPLAIKAAVAARNLFAAHDLRKTAEDLFGAAP